MRLVRPPHRSIGSPFVRSVGALFRIVTATLQFVSAVAPSVGLLPCSVATCVPVVGLHLRSVTPLLQSVELLARFGGVAHASGGLHLWLGRPSACPVAPMVSSVAAMTSSVAPCAFSNSFMLKIVGLFAHPVPNHRSIDAGIHSSGGLRGSSVTAMRCSVRRTNRTVSADRPCVRLSRWYGGLSV